MSPRASAAGAAPLPNSYWVQPGKLLAGEHPQGRTPEETRKRIARLLAAGIDFFVDLTAQQERSAYDEELPFRAEYVRLPIRDHGLPTRREEMVEILNTVESALRDGRRVYVHCRAGIGRTGMVMACLMIERGLSPDDALYELNRLWQSCGRAQEWPYVPETDEQIEYVRSWSPERAQTPAPNRPPGSAKTAVEPAVKAVAPKARSSAAAGPGTRRDRFLGAFLGLAIGDSLAAAAAAGASTLAAWTDDTAMALCLAESLLESNGFDPLDQVSRYTQWQQNGHLSATGTCVGITASTSRALGMAQWRRQMFSGSHDPHQLDPEPLARIAPAVMFFFLDRDTAIRQACDAARTTCQAPLVLDACRLLAVLLHAALEGRSKADIASAGAVLAASGELRIPVRRIAEGAAGPPAVNSPAPGQAAPAHEVLAAAAHIFSQARSFEEGAFLAAVSPGSADVVSAVYGQLAGAHFGAAAIPAAWRNDLIRNDLIADFAGRLLDRTAHQP